MKHNQKKTAFLVLWLFICMLVCLGTGLLAVRRSEASFYKRAAVMAACAPEKAGEMMRSLKREQPEKVEKGEALLKQYGYEAGLFTRADSAGLLSILLLFFSAAVRRGSALVRHGKQEAQMADTGTVRLYDTNKQRDI